MWFWLFILFKNRIAFLLPAWNIQVSLLAFGPIKTRKTDIYTHFLLHIYFVQWLVKESADCFFKLWSYFSVFVGNSRDWNVSLLMNLQIPLNPKLQHHFKPWLVAGGWAGSPSLLAGASPGMELLGASKELSAVSSPQGRNGAVAACSSWGALGLAWGLGIVWVLFPREWGGLLGAPWWLCTFCLEILQRKFFFSSSSSQICVWCGSGKHSDVWNQHWLKIKSKAEKAVLCSL